MGRGEPTVAEAHDIAAPRPLSDIVDRLSGGFRSMESMVYAILREGILTGTLAPGERLHQERLAAAVGVSRVPVRTALLQLESDGLVRFVPRRGAVVTTLTRSQVTEIYEIRELLETTALRKVADHSDAARLARLRELAIQVDTKDEAMEFIEARKEFYRVLYDDGRNPQLYELIEDLRLKVGRYLLSQPARLPHRHTHLEIVDLLGSGEIDAATEALREHLRRSRDNVLNMTASAEAEAAE